MILTERQKGFIIKNRERLVELFTARMEELKEEIINMPQGIARDAKVEMVREWKIWLKDVKETVLLKDPPSENLI